MVEVKEYTTKTPLQMIGEFAGICWGANIKDDEKNIARAIDCIVSGHERTEEFPDVYLVLSDHSAKCIRELYTHIGGAPTRLQASTRYIDYEKKGVEVVTPPSIGKNQEALAVWNSTVETIRSAMKILKEYGIPNEDLTNLLPLAYKTKMVWKVNLRTLVHFMNMRLCSRAYWEIRALSLEIKNALENYSEEWAIIAAHLFRPKCEVSGFCTETKCCRRAPQKQMEFKYEKADKIR